MTLHAKMAKPDLQQYHWKRCQVEYKIDINVVASLNSFHYAVALRKLWSNEETHRNKHFRVREMTFWSDKGFKDTVVIGALSSLHKGSIEITLTALKLQNTSFFYKLKFFLQHDDVDIGYWCRYLIFLYWIILSN